MSKIEVDAIESTTLNGDLVITGNGTGKPDIESGFKINGVAPTSGQVVTDVGWGAVAASGWEFVSSVTASSSASVEFTGMATGFDYTIEIVGVIPATDGPSFQSHLGITGPTYRTSNYLGMQTLIDSGDGILSTEGTADLIMAAGGQGNAADETALLHVELRDPAESGTDTYWKYSIGYHNTGAFFFQGDGYGHYTTSESHTAIRFQYSSGNISDGKFTLYRRANS